MPTPAARSLKAFGLYLAVVGLLLLTVPALALAPLALPADSWTRLVGLLALAVGIGDLVAAREAVEALIRWSVWRRFGAALAMVALVALGLVPAPVLLFAAVDAMAASWTAWSLRGGPTPAYHRPA